MLPKEMLFVSEYLKDFNGTQAAIRAGYSVANAANYASELLRKPHICSFIYEHIQDKVKRNELIIDRIVQELVTIAYASPRKFMNDDGEYLPFCEIDESLKAAVQDYKITRVKQDDGSFKDKYVYKFMDRTKALEMLGRHAAMFTDKKETQHGVTGDFARLMAEINGKTRAL